MQRHDYVSSMLKRMQDEDPKRLATEVGYAERALELVRDFPTPFKEEVFVELLVQGRTTFGGGIGSSRARAA